MMKYASAFVLTNVLKMILMKFLNFQADFPKRFLADFSLKIIADFPK